MYDDDDAMEAANELLEDYTVSEIVEQLIRYGICESDDILNRLGDYILELQETLENED